MPLRRTILHLAQRFRIDGETFMTTPYNLSFVLYLAKFLIIHVRLYFVQLTRNKARDHGTVRIRGFPSVTATECSKCAVNDPSADTTVH